ncbi:hypothetical protein D3C81_716990 [compost metagenome]
MVFPTDIIAEGSSIRGPSRRRGIAYSHILNCIVYIAILGDKGAKICAAQLWTLNADSVSTINVRCTCMHIAPDIFTESKKSQAVSICDCIRITKRL